MIKSGSYERRVSTLGQVLAVLNNYQDPIPDRVQVDVHGPDGRVSLARSQRSPGKLGLHLPGEPKDILEAMLQAELVQCQWPSGKFKLPEEMPRVNWEGLQALSALAWGTYPGLDPERLRKAVDDPIGWQEHLGDLRNWLPAQFKRLAGYPLCGPVLAWCGANERHELHVASALADGKCVPEEVLQDYQTFTDPRWANLLIQRPELRGRLNPDQLRAVDIVFGGRGRTPAREIQVNEIDRLVEVVRQCGPKPTHVEVDDGLYAAGMLNSLEVQASAPADLSGCSAFVLDVRREVTDRRLQAGKDADVQDRKLGRISLREFNRREFNRAQDALSAPVGLGQDLEDAIQSRAVSFLLEVLDQGEGHNVGSKTAVERHFGIRLKGLPAAARRRNIFQLAGFNIEAQRAYEARMQQAKDERMAAKERERLIERVSAVNYRLEDGRVVSGKDYVERMVHQEKGVRIMEHPRGASCRYYMCFEGQTYVKRLFEKDGTLAYARILLEEALKAPESQAEGVAA